MCGVTAIMNFRRSIKEEYNRIEKMYNQLIQRGPDSYGIFCDDHYLLAHTRLAIMDNENGAQPMQVEFNGILYTIIYNGMLYNFKNLKQELEKLGHKFKTNCDTEVVLHSYIEWKEECLYRFNGIFAFLICFEDEAFIARDPFGVKPIYYTQKSDGEWLVASEIKAILSEGSVRPIMTKQNFAHMIALGPSLQCGRTMYKNIYSLRAGEYLKIKKYYHELKTYHHIALREHTDTPGETIVKIHDMLTSCILNQCQSDVGIGSMLSGGIDSSIVCSVASQAGTLDTYSLLFEENESYFKGTDFQPSSDLEYSINMSNFINSNKHFVEIKQKDLADSLVPSMLARDMCGMADIDSSLLLFCEQIRKDHKVVLTGECADEVFGGYPWFYDENLINRESFPWLNYLPNKISLVRKELQKIDFYGVRKNAYEEEIAKVQYLDSDSSRDRIARKMTHLSIYYFMQTLLMRMDAMGSSVGLEARVPFADKDLVDYVYNIPWDLKFLHGKEKGLLREAFKNELPKSVLERKKSPFPKTYHPQYTEYVSKLLKEEMKHNDLLTYYFDYDALNELIETQGNSFSLPWYGQLMKGPQLIGYLYQFSKWLTMYHVIPE